jgi:predicted nucleic acid-binding protein
VPTLGLTHTPDMGGAQGIAAGVALLYAVSGMKVYDARLVASMKAYGITHLLTFNADDFRRYQDITGIEPQQVLLS